MPSEEDKMTIDWLDNNINANRDRIEKLDD